jgi:hypothetical protein
MMQDFVTATLLGVIAGTIFAWSGTAVWVLRRSKRSDIEKLTGLLREFGIDFDCHDSVLRNGLDQVIREQTCVVIFCDDNDWGYSAVFNFDRSGNYLDGEVL